MSCFFVVIYYKEKKSKEAARFVAVWLVRGATNTKRECWGVQSNAVQPQSVCVLPGHEVAVNYVPPRNDKL